MGKAAVEQYIFIDEMQMAGAPAMNLSITSVAPTILREGTEEQKATGCRDPARRHRVRGRLLGAERRHRPRGAAPRAPSSTATSG